MNPGRHFVGNEPSASYKELDRQNACVVEVGEHAFQIPCGQPMPAWRAERSACQPQDSLCVDIAVQGVDRDLTPPAPGADDRHLTVEWDPFFVDESDRPELLPGAFGIFRRPD